MGALLRVVVRFALRNRLRTLLTSCGVATALLAFVMLRALVDNWYTVQETAAKQERVIIRNKISIMFVLFTSQAEKLRQIPGVSDVSWLIWFGGKYKSKLDGTVHEFPNQAVDAESFLRLYPEHVPPGEQKQAFLEDRTGALVGEKLAQREGWKLGDRVALQGTYYPGEFHFTIRGIYPESEGVNPEMFFLHYEYFNQALNANNHVHRLLARVDGPDVIKEIDRTFATSQCPTKTLTEYATQRQWASWSDGVIRSIHAGSLLVLLVLGLVLGNAMAMATRETTREYAAMRAIGYKTRHITSLVLAEGAAVGAIGIVLGLLVSGPALQGFSSLLAEQLGGTWELSLEAPVVVTSAAIGIAMSMLASAWPAWRSSHLPIVDCLRRVA